MTVLRSFIENGGVVCFALVLLTLESLALAVLAPRAGARFTPLDCLLMALPGACLLLALLATQIAGDWRTVALALTIALFAHVGDVWRRWHSATVTARADQRA